MKATTFSAVVNSYKSTREGGTREREGHERGSEGRRGARGLCESQPVRDLPCCARQALLQVARRGVVLICADSEKLRRGSCGLVPVLETAVGQEDQRFQPFPKTYPQPMAERGQG